MMTIDRLDHLVINVRDVEASAAWYQRVLGFERADFAPAQQPEGPKRTALAFGNQKLNLRPVDADQAAWTTAATPVVGGEDLCFITTAGADAVMAHLRACGVAITAGPVPRQGALGPMTSVYCRDPDGNLIEVATYPATT
jgi:catechol 2,3-dioxygenase-like lactoylglutathione lyase family enzyme